MNSIKILHLFSIANSTCCFVKESEKALVQWVRGAFAEVVTAWAKRCRELTAERVL